MSWDQEEPKETKETKVETKEEPKEEPKADPEVKPEVKTESNEGKTEQPKEETKEERMVPQEVVGKVAKAIREKNRGEISEVKERVRLLEEENKRLKEGSEVDPAVKEEDERITLKVRTEYLKQENARGRKKYGQGYQDALDLIAAQKDQALVDKIQWADNPVETLMEEAQRIAETIEYGDDPAERERKKEQALEIKIRKKLEAEFAEKLKARNNQPTDVQNVRAAGGDEKPKYQGDTWESSLPK